MKDDFAERLAVLCEARGLKPKDVAKRAKVDLSRVSRWLSGDNKPRKIDVAIKRVFGIGLAEFYGADLEKLRREARS